MKNLGNLLPWGFSLLLVGSLIALTGLPEKKHEKLKETQIVASRQVKNSEEEDYLSLLEYGLLCAGGIGIFSSSYIKNSLYK